MVCNLHFLLLQAKETENTTISNLSPITKSIVIGSSAAETPPGAPLRGGEVANGLPSTEETRPSF